MGDVCLVEPLAATAHGIQRLVLDGKIRVAIIGAGPVGLCAAALCVPYAGEVCISAHHDAQKHAAEKLGAKSDLRGEYDSHWGLRSRLSRLQRTARPVPSRWYWSHELDSLRESEQASLCVIESG